MSRRRMMAALLLAAAIAVAQQGNRGRRWAQYEHEMQHPADDPPDAWDETEFAWGRLRFHSIRDRSYRARWGVDTNKADRQFLQGLRRLTRIHVRSVEQILDIDHDEMYNWPWMYAVGVGDWIFSDEHASRLRQYFERGGFLMVDDFHNEREWSVFMAGVRKALPGYRVVELENTDPILHTVYDLSERVRVPGLNVVHGDQIERGGIDPHWRAVVDENGRVAIAICFNMDLGDAWEWADNPYYPERYASLAYRIGVNYVTYAMTH
jgi:hypothetical protein